METWLRFFLVALTILLYPSNAAAELWRSPLASHSYFEIQKPVGTVESDDGSTVTTFLPLPAAVTFAAGAQAVEYESFLATYVADPNPLEFALKGTEFLVSRDAERRLQLPHRDFDPLDPADRVDLGFPSTFRARPLAELFVVQFAYSPRPEWYDAWKTCGAEVIATFQSQAALVRASSLAVLTACSNAPYLLWIDSYLSTDRIAPAMLVEENSYGYALQFRPATDLNVKQSGLPAGAFVEAAFEEPESRTRFLEVTLPLADFVSLAEGDGDLLSVTWRGEASFSDERQGQIVAGNVTAAGTVVSQFSVNRVEGRPSRPE